MTLLSIELVMSPQFAGVLEQFLPPRRQPRIADTTPHFKYTYLRLGRHDTQCTRLFDEKRNSDKPITGWAVSKDSPEQIAEAIKDIMARPEKVRAVIATARAMVMEKYDWNIVAKEMKSKKIFV